MSPTGQAARRPVLGVVLVLLMGACFASMDSASRALGRLMPVLVFFWARYAFQALTMAAWLAWRHGRAGFRSAHPRFQLVRGALLAATSAMSFYGVQHMPVPEFTAINMLTPLLVIVLAGWWLHERIDRLRQALVLGGLAGALIVIRPGSGLFGWAVLFPLLGACTYASFQVLTRRLSGTESPTTTHFYTGLTGTLLLLPFLLASGLDLPAILAAAPAGQIGALLLIGLLGTTGHLLLILALDMAPTGVLMPFVYAQIGWATLLGWLLFRQVPDGWALLGMAVITGCGALGAWLNLRGRRADPVVVDTGD